MRRERFFRMDPAEAIELLAGAPIVHLAACNHEGAPLIRALNGVVVDGALCFHAAPVGEKSEAIGGAAVVTVEEIVASVPSYFSDAERACPATTLYRSVQAHGVLEAVTAQADKARVLQALMDKYQPEGQYVPIDQAHPRFIELYGKQVDALLVVRLPLTGVDGKAKLAQNRTPAERAQLCQRLWQRGEPGDARAVELIRAANPDMPTPAFLEFEPRCKNGHGDGSAGEVTLSCALGPRDVAGAVSLLAGQYWNLEHSPERIAAAIRGSSAWVGARDGTGRLVASARAISDGHKTAWIYDVVVAPEWRGRGVGEAVMRLILDHPVVRHVANVFLGTRDAMDFYRRFGFLPRAETPPKPYRTTDMLRLNRAR
jgi:nitroimidazol reductase NimA-like FMN-containing flavoprotein (pyridoxamine 5'-phosphate oxidase superfamily)/ribosomal protein S18 acetylase RimI-like enzyme